MKEGEDFGKILSKYESSSHEHSTKLNTRPWNSMF